MLRKGKKLGGDIKGSKYVLAAINRLIDEGFKIESLFLEGIHSNKMRFYQKLMGYCR